jgi:hypothetical protein
MWKPLALILSGILFLLYPAVRPWSDETTVNGAIQSMGSTAWVASHFFAMLGFILVPLGLLALRNKVPAILFWIGAGLVLPYYGAEDFGLHAIARNGANVWSWRTPCATSRWPSRSSATGLILIAAAGVFTAVVVWRGRLAAALERDPLRARVRPIPATVLYASARADRTWGVGWRSAACGSGPRCGGTGARA